MISPSLPADSASRAELTAATAEISAILASQVTVSLPVSPASAVSTPRGETEYLQLLSGSAAPGFLSESSPGSHQQSTADQESIP